MMHGQVTESIKSDKRALLTPDEVMALPGPKKNAQGDIEEPGEMIIRVAGAAPIRGRQPLYFLDPVFLARAKIAAPADTDRIGVNIPKGEERDFADEKQPAPAGSAKAGGAEAQAPEQPKVTPGEESDAAVPPETAESAETPASDTQPGTAPEEESTAPEPADAAGEPAD